MRAGDRAGAARAHADVLAAERHDHRPASWRGGARRARVRRAAGRARGARAGRASRRAAGRARHVVPGLGGVLGARPRHGGVGRLELRRELPGRVDREARRARRGAPPRQRSRLTALVRPAPTHRLVVEPRREPSHAPPRRRGGGRGSLRRIGRAREHVPRPVPRRNLVRRGRAETAGARPHARHDGARSRQAAVRVPRRRGRQPRVARTTGLSRTEAGRGIALLVHSTRGGLLEPFFSAPVAHKEGWISDLRASAAIVYGRTPRIVVVLAYRPEITEAEARALGRRVAALTVD